MNTQTETAVTEKSISVDELKKRKPLKPGKISWKKDFKRNWVVYVIFIPVFLYMIFVHYLPMFGIIMSFQNFSLTKGIFGSPFNGLENFITLFTGDAFLNALRNTVILGLFNLTIGFAAPVLFALLITSVPYKRFRRAMQTICYLPNFVASVVVVTLMQNFLSENGAITNLLTTFGLERQDWLANPNPPAFWLIYTFMAVWQGFGYGSIIFVSSISNISGDLYEAAAIDGANRWQQVRKITFPCILPMVVMLFVIQVAVVFKAGYDKILLMYTPSTRGVADTLYTYTYRLSFGESRPNYGVSAASGLFQSVVSTVLLFGSNWISRKVTNLAVF